MVDRIMIFFRINLAKPKFRFFGDHACLKSIDAIRRHVATLWRQRQCQWPSFFKISDNIAII